MHRALQLPELSAMICSHVSPDLVYDADRSYLEPDVDGQRDLAALARTCTTFQEHALDQLWCYQATFAHILRCFPDDLWDVPVILDSVDTLVVQKMIRPMVPSDWVRPLLYMARVRTVNCHARVKPSEELFEILSAHLPTDYFFPRLRDLSWSRTDALVRYYRTLFIPTITHLYLEVSTTLSNTSFLPILALQCPHLTEASINHCFDRHFESVEALHVLQSTSLFLRRLPHRLQRVGADFLDQAAFEHLAGLPTLEWLEIFDLEIAPLIHSLALTGISPFARLTNLNLSSSSAQSVNNIVKTLFDSPLSEIQLTVPSGVAFFSALSETLDVSAAVVSLRRLDLTCSDTNREDQTAGTFPSQYLLKTDALRRFLIFANMRQVALGVVGGFELDDALVLEMARAWPHLESLSFTPECPLRIARRVTLAGLRSLAQYCPNLDTLKMEFDTQLIPPPEPPSGRIPIASTFGHLLTGHSPILDSSAVAEFLFDIFPKLILITRNYDSVEDNLYGEDDPTGSVEIFRALWDGVQADLWKKLGVIE
ncbi:hypothetical protein C8R43DRAFT_1174497 [Mycena crocata]|nr:hypothetical protein C8R43DRAFT_1174497 [Mycena crocata]